MTLETYDVVMMDPPWEYYGSETKWGAAKKFYGCLVQTVFAPRREHSRKPAEVMDRIESMYPDQTKLEMYSRESRSGWDAWGFEVGKFDA